MTVLAMTDLRDASVEMFEGEPELAALLGCDPRTDHPVASALAACLPEGPARASVLRLATEVFSDPRLAELVLSDITTCATRDVDPGGLAGTLHFAHGLHALLSHRLTHALFGANRRSLAMAVKAQFTRALGVDLLPQARIGREVWFDHGLGLVIGQTAVIEAGVSLWHGVTLGSNLSDRGADRHPKVREGAVIGAGALLIGNIEVGAGAVVAAGAIVTRSVPAHTTVAGPRAEDRPRRPGAFAGFPTPPDRS
ncbi:serine acetyltransferase [Falsirhodobacter sp. 20TX0035]|uniref:serine acetyltransferase n=1 Tax=Falsirhodobacter sp. 20TX0035 TaxID=3022019 RepID=UPI00232BC6B4|nr:serine acetyltransferase [Falsirhodobacter sp. 20TX0035]MDB6452274.1 serine acetyltransferase [Falsirhodobacter sp. 20TX0035]